jgi:riboflavin biosynthesis pyrimidine reductase
MTAGELRTLFETERSRPLAEREPPPDRPWVALNMASSADGRATVGGKSGGLGNEADRRQFAGLRRAVDCVLVGTGTLAAERYGSMIRDPVAREERVHAGRSLEPVCCIVTRSGRLPLDIPLFHDPEQVVAVYTGSPIALGDVQADVDVERAQHEPTFAAALRDLRVRCGVRVVLCEGGPRVAGALLDEDLLDEVFLTLAPMLVGGNGVRNVIEGTEAEPPVPLELIRVLESEGYVFLRYLVSRPR